MATTFPQSLLYIFSGSVALSIGSIANLPPHYWSIDMARGTGSWKQVAEILLHCPLPKPKAPRQQLPGAGPAYQAAEPFSISISITELSPITSHNRSCSVVRNQVGITVISISIVHRQKPSQYSNYQRPLQLRLLIRMPYEFPLPETKGFRGTLVT